MAGEEQPGRSREDYLHMGLELLAESGPRALTAVRLAAELEVTTGSFYWHFKNVAEFRRAVRSHWRQVVVPEVIAEARSCLELAKRSGGIVVGASNYFVPGTPVENVWALVETIREYR